MNYAQEILAWVLVNNLTFTKWRVHRLMSDTCILCPHFFDWYSIQVLGAWISFPPPPFSLLSPLLSNFHINHSFFKIFIIIRGGGNKIHAPSTCILYQSKKCGHRIHVLFMMYDVYWYCQMKKKRMIMKILKKEWFIWKFEKREIYFNDDFSCASLFEDLICWNDRYTLYIYTALFTSCFHWYLPGGVSNKSYGYGKPYNSATSTTYRSLYSCVISRSECQDSHWHHNSAKTSFKIFQQYEDSNMSAMQ
jgi:hypothetical protein